MHRSSWRTLATTLYLKVLKIVVSSYYFLLLCHSLPPLSSPLVLTSFSLSSLILKDMSREIARLVGEYLGKESKMVKVLKACNQAIIAPAVIELTLNVCAKVPFKDAGMPFLSQLFLSLLSPLLGSPRHSSPLLSSILLSSTFLSPSFSCLPSDSPPLRFPSPPLLRLPPPSLPPFPSTIHSRYGNTDTWCAGGWRMELTKNEDGLITVTHVKQQRSRSGNKEDEFSFEWHLEIIFDEGLTGTVYKLREREGERGKRGE